MTFNATLTILATPCQHVWAYAPTVGNVGCVRCQERREQGSPEAEAARARYDLCSGVKKS